MSQKNRTIRIRGAFGETLEFLSTRPDRKKTRLGEYCDECGTRCKEKSHQKHGKRYLCESCIEKSEEKTIVEMEKGVS